MFFSWLTCILLSVLWFIFLQTFTSGKFCSVGCLKWRVLNLLVLPVRSGTGLGVTTRYQNKGIHLSWNKTQMEDYQNKKEIQLSWNKKLTLKDIRKKRNIIIIMEQSTYGRTSEMAIKTPIVEQKHI